MVLPKLTRLELQIMETLWTQGACSVREIHQQFPKRGRPAFTTVQIFEAAITRENAQSRLIDDLLNLFGGRTKPVMSHLIESGKLTLDEIKEAEKAVRALARKDRKP
jgi:predicted transcriptional regulator